MKANPGIDPKVANWAGNQLVVPKPLVSVKTKEYIELVEGYHLRPNMSKQMSYIKGIKK